jgi:regulator of sirC expression with transglutaminase-like and TPR domain
METLPTHCMAGQESIRTNTNMILRFQDYDQLLQIKPNDADALYGRGLTYAQLGDDDRAIRDYDQMLRISPNHAAALYSRSNAHACKREFLRAAAD